MNKFKRSKQALPHPRDIQARKILACAGMNELIEKLKSKYIISLKTKTRHSNIALTANKLREFYHCSPQDKANKTLRNLFINVRMTVNNGLSDLLSQIFPDTSKRVRSNLN